MIGAKSDVVRLAGSNLHEVSLEKFGQLPLGRRICEVTDIESATLCSAGQDCLVVGSIGALVTTSGGGFSRLVRERCVAKSGSNVVDSVRNFLHDGRHD